MATRLQTGIEVLDRKLDGGLPPGCVVALTAQPASQSELILYELTAARGSLYISTARTDDAVRHAMEESKTDSGNPTVRHVSSDSPLEEAEKLVGALPDGANLIIDPMDILEGGDRDEYLAFLNRLKERMIETGSIAFLHCLKGDGRPPNRDATEHLADAVFDLSTSVDGMEIENLLAIPKYRAGGAPVETIKLQLSEAVEIDTSRDIA